MKRLNLKTARPIPLFLLLSFLLLFVSTSTVSLAQSDTDYTLCQGVIKDSKTNQEVVYSTIAVEGTNIATVSNLEGKFEIKIPKQHAQGTLILSSLGYTKKSVPISSFTKGKEKKIHFIPQRVKLDAVVVQPKDARSIIKSVLEQRRINYGVDPVLMTGFYRETIRKRRKYVAVSEAVVEIYKQPFYSSSNDYIRMLKGRKNSDTSKLDTLLFKLQGGAYTALMLDIIKDPYMILSEEMSHNYDYTYNGITQQDNALYYIIEFKQRQQVEDPLYYGKIFVHSDNMAIASVAFSLNTEDKRAVGKMLIKKKPSGANVYPTTANYLVHYQEKDGKWYFNYSRAGVEFKVNWKKKWFNSKFTTSFELAITDKFETEGKGFRAKERMKSSTIMADEISGFTDLNFWGAYNVIKPEEPINSAIEKIRKNLAKLDEE